MNFLPKELKDFSILLNPTNLKMFSKVELIKFSYQLVKSKAPTLDSITQKNISGDLDGGERSMGNFALRLYFYQIMRGGPFCIDLRSSQFSFGENWFFKGERLSFTLSDKTRNGLINIYDSFYNHHSKSIIPELEALQLIGHDWSVKQKKELESIFINHFKSSKTEVQKFELKGLVSSFSEIFSYIKKQDQAIPSEFAIFGLYLTALYMTLSKTDDFYDVKKQYLFTLNLINS